MNHVSAADAAAQGQQWSELRSADGWLCWLEFDPADGKTRLRARHDMMTGSSSVLITDDRFSVRSRVHEYGGGAFCLISAESPQKTQLVFVNEFDQKLYIQPLVGGKAPVSLLDSADQCTAVVRFGDLVFDPVQCRILAIRETHPVQACPAAEVVNELVSISLSGSASGAVRCVVTVLAEGKDFYASPRVSPCGARLAWLGWNHPKQPWLSTTLTVADSDGQGGIQSAVDLVNPSQVDISVVQPEFDHNGDLLFVCDSDVSDNQQGLSGWWNLYRYHFCDDGADRGYCLSLNPCAYELGVAQWQLGLKTYAPVPVNPVLADECGSRVVASYFDHGLAGLGTLDAVSGVWTDSRERHARFHSVIPHDVDGDVSVACFMESGQSETQLVVLPVEAMGKRALSSCVIDVLGHDLPKHKAGKGECQPFSYPTADGEQAFGFYYPPSRHLNDSGGRHSGAPPLLIQLHGGPTAMADTSFDPLRPFWLQRGFALLVLNYRGSSGFGRDYRHALCRRWGMSDVDDVLMAARYAVEQGWADSQRLFVRGNSAGGYTVLRVLGQASGSIRAGASHYGISDLMRLNQRTHKFESHYLSWLIGDPCVAAADYQSRSPAFQSMQRPVIFFQGDQDRVVPPEQTLNLHQQLQVQGVLSEHHLFPGEGHGFRQAQHREQVLNHELAFYRKVMS